MENDFLKNLPSQQVREIVEYMEKKKVVAGAYVIKEGDTGKNDKCNIIILLFFSNMNGCTNNSLMIVKFHL